MNWLSSLVCLGVIALAFLLFRQMNKEVKDTKKDLEISEGVIDVRRKAEEAKHNDPDAIKRVRDKYNS